MNRFLPFVLVILVLLLSSCSERSEYGETSDYEKLGAGSTDKTAPTVSSVSPTDNSIYNSPATTIVVTFSETILTSSITTNTSDTTCSGSFQLSSNNFTTCVKMSAIPSASDNVTTFTATPADNISSGTIFKLRITTSVKDTSSNSLVSTYTTNGFTTSPLGSGTIKGSVKMDNGTALSSVSVALSIYGTTAANVTSDSSGDFSQSSLGLGVYSLTFTKSDYLNSIQSATLATDNQTVTANVVLLADNCTAGTVSGTISDAVSGSDVSGVSLSVRSGLSVTSGSTTDITATSASNGTYTLSSMNAGGYTVQVSINGYITSFFNVGVCGNLTNQNAAISENLSSGSMRIILHWGASSDLTIVDSHLTGPDNTSGRFHIYWPDDKREFFYYTNDQVCSGCTSIQKSDNVTLDKDDTDAPGTETITIPGGSWRSGTYRYSAHDYTTAGSNGNASSTKFAESGTTVKVYYNGTETTYNVPNLAGTVWKVLTIDGDSKVITAVNGMTAVPRNGPGTQTNFE